MRSNRKTRLLSMLIALTIILGVSSTTPVLAENTTYYVSPSGNDSNSGTSANSAWKTLAKVSSVTFQPGDRILFQAGGSWNGQLTLHGSGTSGSPIVLSRYGTGDDPIINGNGASYTIRLDNQEYWEISEIQIMNTASTKALRIGLYITATDAGTLDHIYIQDVYFHDIVSKAPDYSPGSHESAGSFTGAIVGRIFGSSVPTRFNDVLIENCKFEECDRNMFYFFDSPWYNDSGLGMSGGAGAMYNSTNVVVRNNYAVDIPGTGTCLCSCDGAILEYNVIDNCQYNVPSNVAGVACSTWSSQNCIYQYNEVFNTHGTADGQSFDNDGACRDCIFQYNYSHDNNGGFILVCSLSSCKVYNSVWRYNISQNDRSGLIDHRAASYNTLIYNNTIYTKSGLNVPMFRTDTSSKAGTASFYNNIFYNAGTSRSGSYGSFTWDYNCFYGNWSSYPNDSHKITSNPQLVNPGSGTSGGESGRGNVDGYKLQSTSPCINAGRIISNNGGKDYWGNTLYNGAPDIGAHEYEGDVDPEEPPPIPVPGAQVDLSYYFNDDGFSYDTNRADGNLDGSGYSYSADLVSGTLTYNNIDYVMGPFTNGEDNVVDCIGQTIDLYNDEYDSINLLASATNGDQSGVIRINYTDSTYTNVNVSMKDWCVNSGTVVKTMAHRHSQTADATPANYIFLYTLTPSSGKTVESITLPDNQDMHIYAITLVEDDTTSTPANDVQIDLSSYFNDDGFSYDTDRTDGDYDGNGYTYSADLVDNTPSYNGVDYQLGSFSNGANNVIDCSGQTIPLVQGQFSSVNILASSTGGNKSGTFRLYYTDATYTDKNISIKDWCTGNDTAVLTMSHRHSQTNDSAQINKIFLYTITPSSGKTLSSIKLPSNSDMHVLAITLVD